MPDRDLSGEEKSEFVAANPKGGVRGAQRLLKSIRGSFQNIVATGMAIFIIHFLKAMQVENDEAKRQSVAACAIQFLLERLGKQTTVVETRKRIRDGIALQLFVIIEFEENRERNSPAVESTSISTVLKEMGRPSCLESSRRRVRISSQSCRH